MDTAIRQQGACCIFRGCTLERGELAHTLRLVGGSASHKHYLEIGLAVDRGAAFALLGGASTASCVRFGVG